MEEKSLLICNEFMVPDTAATGQLIGELKNEMEKIGIKTEVYCMQPHYYGAVKNREKKEENVKRFFSIKCNESRIFSAVNQAIYFCRILLKIPFSGNEKILLTTNPFFLPVAGFVLKKIFRKKYFVLVWDLYPDMLAELKILKKNGTAYGFLDWVLGKALDNAEKIFVLDQKMAEKISEGKKIGKNKIVTISLWKTAEESKGVEKFRKQNSLENKFLVMHAGNMGATFDAESIAGCMAELKDEKNIVFAFVGNGFRGKALKEKIQKLKLNAVFADYQQPERMPGILASADVLAVSFRKEFAGISVPSKTCNYMAAGKPIIAFCPKESETAKTIENAKCGFVAESPLEGANAIKQLFLNEKIRRNFGKNGKVFAEKNFSPKCSAEKISREIFPE